jgi:hypothetical protein
MKNIFFSVALISFALTSCNDDDVDTTKLSEKFGAMSNEDLLDQYRKDAETEFDNMVDLMESKANIPSEEIKFNVNQN